jgi:hypothetical protein
VSIDDLTRHVIVTKSFDAGDTILHKAVRDQVGDVVKRLHKQGQVEKIGRGRAMKWNLKD